MRAKLEKTKHPDDQVPIDRDQRSVIEKILRHCGWWEGPIRTLAKSRGPPKGAEQNPNEPRELQLVLDPEFL